MLKKQYQSSSTLEQEFLSIKVHSKKAMGCYLNHPVLWKFSVIPNFYLKWNEFFVSLYGFKISELQNVGTIKSFMSADIKSRIKLLDERAFIIVP